MTSCSRLCVTLLLAVLLPAMAAAQPPSQPPLEVEPSGAPQADAATPDRTTRRGPGRPVFRMGSDYTLPAGDVVREVAIVSGDARIDGATWGGDVVVIFGTATLSSTAEIDGSLVVIGGRAVIDSGALIRRDLVVIGSDLDAAPGFMPGGDHIVVGPRIVDAQAFGRRLEALIPWVTQGLLWGRVIVPDIPWVWWIVGTFFLIYLALNAVFDAPVAACAQAVRERPLSAFLVGLLVLLLAGPVFLLLTVSVVGLLVVPFAFCALLLAWVVGKVAVARGIGISVIPEGTDETTPVSAQRLQSVRSFAIGFAVLCVAYMVPVLGLVAWSIVGVVGLGAAALAFASGYRRENPLPLAPAPPAPPVPDESPRVPCTPIAPPSVAAARHGSMPAPDVSAVAGESGSSATVAPAALIACPHASFRDRLFAFVLDLVLVGVAAQLLDGPVLDLDDEPGLLLLALAYHIGFWTWKGTTVGGIICQLRVVRMDGAPLRFIDALVRGLSSIFSLAALGLGGLAILRDPERQAWHDRIAGTYVVKVPRDYPI